MDPAGANQPGHGSAPGFALPALAHGEACTREQPLEESRCSGWAGCVLTRRTKEEVEAVAPAPGIPRLRLTPQRRFYSRAGSSSNRSGASSHSAA